MNTTNESAGGFPANGLTAAQNAALTAEIGTIIADAYGPERFLQLFTTLYYNYTRFIIEDNEKEQFTGVDEPVETTGLLYQLSWIFRRVVSAGTDSSTAKVGEA